MKSTKNIFNVSQQIIQKKAPTINGILNKTPSIKQINKTQKADGISLTLLPTESDFKKQDSFTRLDLSIPTTLKVRKPRCCTNCKTPGHFRNKCPELMSKALIPTSEKSSGVTSQLISKNHSSPQSSIKFIQNINGEQDILVKSPSEQSQTIVSTRPPPTPRTEVQAHGKTWEIDILVNVYGADAEKIKTTGYTAKYDLKADDNKLDHSNLSVKTTGNGTIYMGDCLRIYKSLSNAEPYHLVVINYVQRGQYKHVTRIIEFDITGLKTEFFGTLTQEQISQLATAVKAIPQKRSPTADEKKALYDLKRLLQPLSGIVGLDIKCNSTQSRLQCSISAGKFKALLAKYPTRIIAVSNNNEFRGGSIRESIPSEKRKLKKKTQQTTQQTTLQTTQTNTDTINDTNPTPKAQEGQLDLAPLG